MYHLKTTIYTYENNKQYQISYAYYSYIFNYSYYIF